MMTVGSLFSGIGGFDLGLERCGFEIKWQVEIDPYAVKVLTKHWPNVPKYGDIRAIDWGTVEPVDVLCGGFPCQDLSFAGKRAGIDGERSGLWSEYVRAIRALRPLYIIVENVPGLLTNAYMGRVLGDLAESGYDAEWEVIPACAVGANHRRDRVWIVAHASSQRQRQSTEQADACRDRRQARMGAEKRNHRCSELAASQNVADARCSHGYWRKDQQEPTDRQEAEWSQRANHAEQRREVVADTNNKGQGQRCTFTGGRAELEQFADWWAVEPNVGRMAHGIPKRVDRLRGLGNAVVPQIVEWVGRRILAVTTEVPCR